MILPTKSGLVMFCEKIFFRFVRKSTNVFYSSLKLRPSSYPYLTGDSFRKLADYVYDETTIFKPEKITTGGGIVFVSQERLPQFFAEVHPKINHPYILICHNGDKPQIDESIVSKIDDKIIRFYAQCVLVAHPKIVPIPIGIANKHHGIELFSKFIELRPLPKKQSRIFYHFSIQTNPTEREPALNYFRTHPLMATINTFIPYLSYKKLLASYLFTVSPAGNTLGSHRTWEALYLRTIPIVKRTVDAEACVSYGLPIWIVDDWHKLEGLTENNLQTKYNELMKNASFEALYMDYWKKRILADKIKI